jgi:hypothetical protein
MSKARLCVDQADQRVIEIVYLASKGDARQIEVVTENLNERLVLLTTLVLPEATDTAPEAFTAKAPEEAPAEEEAMLAVTPDEPSPSLAPPPEEAPLPSEELPTPAEEPPSPAEEPPPPSEEPPPPAEGAAPPPEEPLPSEAADQAAGEDDREPPTRDGNRAELKEAVISNAIDHVTALHQALVESPEAVKQGLRRAISVSEAGYQRALEALD